ncbi:hypothetical protein OIU80_20255, partial [Flavobacterium sp. LS1R47]|nr:hypothetical protein [Flavobacterium frigoritolerans]
AGGTGVPGADGTADIDGIIQMYIDYETGIVYVRDPKDPSKWITLSGNGPKGDKGDDGKAFTFNDFTLDQLAGLKGADGANGKDFEFGDFTPEQLAGLKGADGANGKDFEFGDFTPEQLAGIKGADGANGKDFEFGDFTPEQLAGLKGADGANGKDFEFGDFTPEQLAGLKGADGANGKDFEFGDFTPEQLSGLKGADGANGKDFEFGDFTSDQLAGLKGAQGEKGEPGPAGLPPTSGAGTITGTGLITVTNGANNAFKDSEFSLRGGQSGQILQTYNETPIWRDKDEIIQEPWFSTTTKLGATSNKESIYTDGWVGIGYDTPSGKVGEKLRVNGSVTTVHSTYADYVFEDYFQGFSDIKVDYKFKKLAEIEDYIKTFKHLPGITPINELEKTAEGYSFNMSELSIQLLEKTEEIYLHIIEQNNAIIAKDREIEKMNERLERLEKLILANSNSNK